MEQPISLLDGLEGGGEMTNELIIPTEQEITDGMATEFLDRTMYAAALRDPLTNYACEQEHFIKYAPQSEVQAWVDWNKREKEAAFNKYASSKTKILRHKGEIPAYIHDLLVAADPTFDLDKSKQNAFYKRNPLFCIPEVI